MHLGQLEFGSGVKEKKIFEHQVERVGQQMITFGTGFTAVPREQDGIITVQVWTVLFDVLTVYFPKHLATTALLLPGKKNRKADTWVADQISSENTQ